MSIAIVWSDTAELTFDAIVNYLENSRGEASARKFVRRTNQILKNLSQQPYMFKSKEIDNDVRIGLITSQTSVIYKIHPKHIYLLYFWDNRQQPIP